MNSCFIHKILFVSSDSHHFPHGKCSSFNIHLSPLSKDIPQHAEHVCKVLTSGIVIYPFTINLSLECETLKGTHQV